MNEEVRLDEMERRITILEVKFWALIGALSYMATVITYIAIR